MLFAFLLFFCFFALLFAFAFLLFAFFFLIFFLGVKFGKKEEFMIPMNDFIQMNEGAIKKVFFFFYRFLLSFSSFVFLN